MPRRENTFRVDYSQFPKQLSHDEIHKFVGKELGLSRENVLLLQPSRRLGCTFVEVNNLDLAEAIVKQHDNKHEFVFDGKIYKLRIMMEDGAVEVRLFDLSNDASNEQVAEFLGDYGDVLNVRDLLWDERSAFGGIRTGVRIARMVVKKNIPSLVSILGEETAVGYKGQRQTCIHCQEFVHVGIPCVQNKKLLVQKLAADQSYASVTKQPTISKKTAVPNPSRMNVSESKMPADTSRKQTTESRAAITAAVPEKITMAPPVAPTAPNKHPAAQSTIAFPPVSALIGNNAHRKSDGNETDSSQTSNTSNNSRRTRSQRSPPGKKMRHSKEAHFEHGRVSGDERQQ